MTLQLHLPPALEQQLNARAAEQGKDISEVVSEMVTMSLVAEEIAPHRKLSSEEFKRRLHAMANRYPGFGGNVDDSRESIYAGRGE